MGLSIIIKVPCLSPSSFFFLRSHSHVWWSSPVHSFFPKGSEEFSLRKKPKPLNPIETPWLCFDHWSVYYFTCQLAWAFHVWMSAVLRNGFFIQLPEMRSVCCGDSRSIAASQLCSASLSHIFSRAVPRVTLKWKAAWRLHGYWWPPVESLAGYNWQHFSC